jgi:peptide/nickel transport system permease protein
VAEKEAVPSPLQLPPIEGERRVVTVTGDGGFLMAVMVLVAVFADGLATHDPIATDAAHTLARPGAEHWLGSDHLGRDIYSRIVHGARVSLIVGLTSMVLGSVVGGIVGLLSGYAGGTVDLIAQRVLDILQGLPLLVLALVMSAALGPSIPNVILAISIPIVPRAARVVRSSVLTIREMQYVEAARGLGLSHLRIAFRHVMPNTMGPFIVLCTAPARERDPRRGRPLPRPRRA